jgi:hypothetical protein
MDEFVNKFLILWDNFAQISHNVLGLRRFLWRNKETRSVSRHKKCAGAGRGSEAVGRPT